MTICFPVTRNDGLESQIFEHFGLAPMFLLVDAKTGEVEEQANRNEGRGRGGRQPFKALVGKTVDAVVVGEIGQGALAGLHQAGFKIFQAQAGSIADNLSLLTEGNLTELSLNAVCRGFAGARGQGRGLGQGRGRGQGQGRGLGQGLGQGQGQGRGRGRGQGQGQGRSQDIDPYSGLGQGKGARHEFGCGF